MISFTVNGSGRKYSGDEQKTLLDYLRVDLGITSAKDGCSGEGTCGSCSVIIDDKPKLSCKTRMKDLEGKNILTAEGIPDPFRSVTGKKFAEKGAVQCGFCSPGMIIRAYGLYKASKNPSREEITRAITPNLCRCTGYIKIIDAIEAAFKEINGDPEPSAKKSALIGEPFPKYDSIATALGETKFVDDLRFDEMAHVALRFSDHPRARILKIDTKAAEKAEGVIRIVTAFDIPGERFTGLIFNDWPLIVSEGETTSYIGDVIAGVAAENESLARKAAALISIEYEIFQPVTDIHEAVKSGATRVHHDRSNVLETCNIRTSSVDKAFSEAAFTTDGIYETQRIEHAFLETETAVAIPENRGIRLFSQGQGIYVDRRQVAQILGIPETDVKVVQVHSGGGFGGKEDLTVQGHASLFAYLLKRPARVHLTREESIIMHPKRHPVWMDISLACDKNGKFTALRLNAIGDTGAYASVGTKVMERVVGHATGGYTIPEVDINAATVYTNNIPSGAMRGFGVPQVVFALESCIDELCKKGGFDRWQIRFDNALENGSRTATGQLLRGVGLKKTLLAVKEAFRNAKYAGIACGLKNTGVGNGMTDDSEVKIEIVSGEKVIIHHGWTEMGQGIHTMAIQVLHHETGIDPGIIEVIADTGSDLPTGMTTSSRATALAGNAIINASKRINEDLLTSDLNSLSGRVYRGKFICDWTTSPGSEKTDPVVHFAYGYATQVAILDDEGNVTRIIAAHDAGRIMNRMLFEGQVEGSLIMGLGYALTEDLPVKDGRPVSLKLNDTGILRAGKIPEMEIIGIEEKDPVGPYGAKGIGEIGMVPTAAAIANALCFYDGIRRTKLPMGRKKG
jgi:aldehyde oxidoreductase